MLEQLFFSHKIYEVSRLVCWVHQGGYINLGDWLGLKGPKASLPVLAGCWLGHFNSPPQSVSSPRRLDLHGSLKVPRRWKQKLQGALRPKLWDSHNGPSTTLYWLNQVTRSSPASKRWRKRLPLDGRKSSHIAKGHAFWMGGICGH